MGKRRFGLLQVVLVAALLATMPGLALAAEDGPRPIPDHVLDLIDKAGAKGRILVIVRLQNKRAQDEVRDRAVAAGAEVAADFELFPILSLRVNANALQGLANSPHVVSIQEDIPQPPALASSLPVINADDVHALGYDGTGQTVAILDTGSDLDHPFLAGRIVSEACYSNAGGGSTRVTLCPNGTNTQVGAGASDAETAQCLNGGANICAHGSHVAGIAAGAASGHAGEPGDGVAPGANIISIQIFTRFNDDNECGGLGTAPCVLTWNTDQISGLQRVLALTSTFSIASANMSLGGGPANSVHCDSDSLKVAIDNLLAAGVATVIAAGNDGFLNGVSSPGCISTAVTVGSTTDADGVSSFSNRGPLLDLFAPGSSIVSSIPDDIYANFNGTSMATPHVAGAFAVMKAANPALGVNDILTALQDFGVDITYSTGSGAHTTPRIDLLAAVNSVTTSGPINVTLVINDGQWVTTSPNVTVDLSAFDADGVTRYRLANSQAGLDSAADVIVSPAETNFSRLNVSFALTAGDGPGKEAWLRVCNAADQCADGSDTIELDSDLLVNPTPVLIPDSEATSASPYPSNIAVSGLIGSVSDVTVTLHGISHSWPDDLDILLVGPGGVTVILMSDAVGDSGSALNDHTLSFNDAATALPVDAPISSGTYQPTNHNQGDPDTFFSPAPAGPHGSTLSSFDGQDPNATWSLYVMDDFAADGGQIARGWTLAITTTAPEPSCALDPTSGIAGSQFEISCVNHNPNETVNIYWDNTGGAPIDSFVSDGAGAGSTMVTVPAVPAGAYDVIAIGEFGLFNTIEVFTVLPSPECLLNPTSGAVGVTVAIDCDDFQPGETVTVHWDTAGGIQLATFNADSNGDGSTSIIVPSATGGNHNVVAVGGTSGAQTTDIFNVIVTTAAIAVNPAIGTVGTVIASTLSGFAPNESVAIDLVNEVGDVQQVTSTIVGGAGTRNFSFAIPQTPRGVYSVRATGVTSGSVAATPLEVLPSVTHPSSVGFPGAGVTFSFRGYLPGEVIDIVFVHGAGDPDESLGTVTADANGSAVKNVPMPSSARGSHAIRGDGNQGTTTQTSYLIAPMQTVSRTFGPAGTAITLTLSGWLRNTELTVRWYETTSAASPSVILTTVVSDNKGFATVVIQIPESPHGYHRLETLGGGNTKLNNIYAQAAVTLNPTTGTVGTPITATLTGYGAGEQVTVRYYTTPSSFTDVGTATVDANGSGSLTFNALSGLIGSRKVMGVGQTTGVIAAKYFSLTS